MILQYYWDFGPSRQNLEKWFADFRNGPIIIDNAERSDLDWCFMIELGARKVVIYHPLFIKKLCFKRIKNNSDLPLKSKAKSAFG